MRTEIRGTVTKKPFAQKVKFLKHKTMKYVIILYDIKEQKNTSTAMPVIIKEKIFFKEEKDAYEWVEKNRNEPFELFKLNRLLDFSILP